MNNYKLIIQYDGTEYAGWQIQNNAVTIQQKITDAIEIIAKEKVNLIGSGRTDTGVHAWGQTANFRIEQELNLYQFQYSLNSVLPKDISVKLINKVDESFHSRFDAKSRSYIYLFTSKKSPFFFNYSYYLPAITEIDFVQLNDLSKALIGKHDFTSYSRKNVDLEDKNCNISNIWWRKGKDVSTFYITADRFLHGMVRTIIGTLLFAEKNKLDQEHLIEVINKKNREDAAESVPAKGLFLFKVRY
jgi:tRNA pseudouridine38-40 synthase